MDTTVPSGWDGVFVSASREAQTPALPGNPILHLPLPPHSLLGLLQAFSGLRDFGLVSRGF